MKAIVLVGGEGTRLRPLTFTTPKPLLPIANQPFLERQLDWLSNHRVDEVVLSMGYLPDSFHAHFSDASGQDTFRGIRLHYAVESVPLGTAGAIKFAASGIHERFIVCNGDVLTDLDLSAMVEFHDARGAEATIALTQVEDPSAFGVVPTAPDGGVIAFVEKPAPGSAPSDWINAGTYVLEPSFLDRIPPRILTTPDGAGRLSPDWPILLSTHGSFELAANWWLPSRIAAAANEANAYLTNAIRNEILRLREGFGRRYRPGESAPPEVDGRIVSHFAPRIEVLADEMQFVGSIALVIAEHDPRFSDVGLDQKLKRAVIEALMAELGISEGSHDAREFGDVLRRIFLLPADHPDLKELEDALDRIPPRHRAILRNLYLPDGEGWKASAPGIPSGGARGRMLDEARESLIEQLPYLSQYRRITRPPD